MARPNRFRLPTITEAMSVTNPRAAGIDVGSRMHAVAIPAHLSAEPCRTFGCTTPDLQEMAAWLLSHGITTVAMESTGNYWVQPLRILEAAGLHVILVHPEYARQAKRTKYSDLDDSLWLQQMHAYGLLPASFLPPALFQRLRTLWRHREKLIGLQASGLQRIQNTLELMNVQLHKAVTDISGLTGLRIIRAIVGGEHDPVQLARYRDPHIHCSLTDLIKALTGDYREEELFVLRQLLEEYDFAQQQLDALDAQVDAFLHTVAASLPPGESTSPEPSSMAAAPRRQASVRPALASRKRPSKHEPTQYDWHALLTQLCGVDATRICGLSVLLVLAILAEIGTDLSPWETVKRFTAWLGLAPDHRVSGGKVLKRHTRRGKPHAAHPFYVAALAASKSQTPLGEFFRFQKARIGGAKALTATARKIAELYYCLLTYGPDFVEHGQQVLHDQSQKRKRRKLERLARALGVTIVDPAVAA